MRLSVRELALCAVLSALAMGLGWMESFLPAAPGIPGIRLGLANTATVFALYALGPVQALCILFVRCTLGSVFAGNLNALVFSLLGGFAAMGTMILLSRWEKLSIYGVSIGGAAAHNCGQVAAAVLVLGSAAPLYYLPVLLGVSLATGSLTGLVCARLFHALEHAGILTQNA